MSDTIQKTTVLKAPIDRVWRAISDSSEFGSWFGVKFDQPFTPGATMRGVITPTTVDEEVAKSQKPYEGKAFEITVDEIDPGKLFSFRWHPFAVEVGRDYSLEPTTLIVFALEELSDGTKLTITESGFDQIPIERRAKALEMNDGGWAAQLRLIEKYLVNVR